ncbi:alpha-aminoadipic semialdehyde dehydrogenase-like [Copidosoma floridanum]|uniref:alpha-aminoadipic semialdehyde dehydrogenase-like n=1 Tax=Copidosoma floridanum TaxID=29053 RepID=UPI0006C952D8|nr:alpha-aminoadipic semialdehyde dehydrogenase-like [Copidosoma floridanum]
MHYVTTIKPFYRSILCRNLKFSTHSQKYEFLRELEIDYENPGLFDGNWGGTGQILHCISPTTESVIAKIQTPTVEETIKAIQKSLKAWYYWRSLPIPKRGEVVRQIGNELRRYQIPLGKLISLEMGKILSESYGEVQEYIDICDYAVGLSRMLPGKIIPSERSQHILIENWNPLGVIGIITAFNFPIAVFGWNNAIALVCGNTTVWKSSPTTSLSSIAVTRIISRILNRHNISGSIATLVTGGSDIGKALAFNKSLPLISFTGSTTSGLQVAQEVQQRFGKTILELGGNNAIIV